MGKRQTSEPTPRGRPLRVLIVSQPVDAGVAICSRDLAAAAVERGDHVTVASPPREEGPLAQWVEDLGAAHESVFNSKRGPTLTDIRDFIHVRRLARGHDVVHVHSSKAGAIGRLAVRTLMPSHRPKVAFTPHAWSWLIGGRLAPVYRLLEKVLASRCDAIVAVSEGEARTGREALGETTAPIVVIANGVDRERFSPAGSVARRDPDLPLLVCVGRLSRQKGQDVAIEALAHTGLEHARLRLVGDGPARDTLVKLATDLGVEQRVELVGHVDDVAPHYRAADIVVAPSRWEGMSLSWLEAMACGGAMVVSDVPGTEAVDGCAVVVPPADPAALASAVSSLLTDEEARSSLQRAALARSRHYDLKASVQNNLRLWDDLAGGVEVAPSRLPEPASLPEDKQGEATIRSVGRLGDS